LKGEGHLYYDRGQAWKLKTNMRLRVMVLTIYEFSVYSSQELKRRVWGAAKPQPWDLVFV